jgi:nucleotide-binding universal stress UspA family protein
MTAYQTVVVGTDGSESSLRAVDRARAETPIRCHLARWATAQSSATPAIVGDNHANPVTDAVS